FGRPLAVGGIWGFVRVLGLRFRYYQHWPFFAVALMMLIFFHAARIAIVRFDPYLGSKPLADALMSAPAGKLIGADAYYAFSSVFFYTNRSALLWNGRVDNLEYGSYAPAAPDVFIDDRDFQQLWCSADRYYLLAYEKDLQRIRDLAGDSRVYVVTKSGGKYLLTK